VVYLHGGGWTVGSLNSFDRVSRSLAHASGAEVLTVGYRLAPEHPFRAPLDDSVAAVRWAVEQTDRVAVAGDSAGGNLATGAARLAGVPLRGQLLIYPALDPAMDSPSHEEFGGEEYGLARRGMEQYWDFYLGDADRDDPDANPMAAPESYLRGLPPALVLTAEYDPLRDEGEAYARRMRDAGVPVELERVPGLVHGFFRWAGRVEAARRTIDRSGKWLTEVLDPV
jgi:acetyl esterase